MPNRNASSQLLRIGAASRITKFAALTTAAMCASTAAFSQGGPSPAELQIKYRQGVYTVIGGNFAPLGAMATGKRPWDGKNAALRAERVAYLARMAQEAFPEGSSAGSSAVPTKAKAEIWANRAEFDKLMKDLVDKTQALANVAKTGNQERVKAAFNAAGQACKACHDRFKME
jgi:cytochrome c556